VQHHGAALRALGETELAEVVAKEWRQADIDGRFRALLEYAEELTRDPGALHQRSADRLREVGWDDEAILHACEVVSYFNFVNRMADGLGVALEADWPHPILGSWQVSEAATESGRDTRPPGQ
jgi:uncharacterized peroxidase-related enzyme